MLSRLNPNADWLILPIMPLTTKDEQQQVRNRLNDAIEVVRRLRPDAFQSVGKRRNDGN